MNLKRLILVSTALMVTVASFGQKPSSERIASKYAPLARAASGRRRCAFR